MAAPSGTNCPPSFTLRTVASLAATGNAPNPGLLDAAGNNDGWVCAKALPDQACTPFIVQLKQTTCLVETIYFYKDNNSPTR